jgi:hypothetical protein
MINTSNAFAKLVLEKPVLMKMGNGERKFA